MFWFAEEAYGGMMYVWPITAGILVIVAIGAIASIKSKNARWTELSLWGFLLFSFPFLIIAFGIIWAGSESDPNTSSWRSIIVNGTAVVEAFLAVVAVIRARGVRLLMTGVIALHLWFTFWCLFMAGMSIADDWI